MLDAVGADKAIVVGLSFSGWYVPLMAAEYPDRVMGIVVSGGISPLVPMPLDVTSELDSDEDWAKFNHHYWRRDYRGFLDFFFAQIFTEPHSTKQIEDATSWALEISPETLIDTIPTPSRFHDKAEDVYARVRCPALVIHGDSDGLIPYENGVTIAEAIGTPLLTVEGGGHSMPGREPVRYNLLFRDFIEFGRRAAPTAPPDPLDPGDGAAQEGAVPVVADRARPRPPRPRHRRRAARAAAPTCEIDWLAQDPVTAVLERAGEGPSGRRGSWPTSRPTSSRKSGEHDLHCFQALRRMDEILVANFMVFHDLRHRASATTSSSATRPGTSTTSCTRTPS